MQAISLQHRKTVIGTFCYDNIEKGKAYTVKHFKAMNVPKTTIYRVIATVKKATMGRVKATAEALDGNCLQRKPGSGGCNAKLDKAKLRKLKQKVNNKTGVSQRKLANEFNVCQATISNSLKRVGVKYHKRKKAAKVSAKQKAVQQRRLSKLRRNQLKPTVKREIVMDDESYFTLTGSGMPGNSGFYTADKSSVPPNIQYYGKKKFPERVMVWCAISSHGVSKPYILSTGETINHVK